MVIGGTGEMDCLQPTPLWIQYYYYCAMFMFTLHPKTLQTLRHLEMDGTARCIDGSPTRTSIYHTLPQAPRLYIFMPHVIFSFRLWLAKKANIHITGTPPFYISVA